jgi:large subunit ribosomal protein L10
MSDFETHVSEAKKAKVKELAELMKRKTVMVISVKGLPSAQFQDIKKKIRDRATVKVAKKSVVGHALNEAGAKELEELIPYLDDSTAMLFSDEDAFELSGVLGNEKSPQKAKAGQVAPFDIEVKAGPTELLPGPDISALSAVGLAPKVEGGKIAVMQDKVICAEGKIISDDVASIMAKLDIIPFEVGVEPVAAFMGGQVYADIKIDVEGAVSDLEFCAGRALALDVELGIVNDLSLDLILGKAAAQEATLTRVVTGEPEPEVVAEAVALPEEEKKEEVKEEAPAESAAGLASLFG